MLSLRNLQLSMQRREGALQLLQGISFELAAGAALGLVGESGSGKSLTALALMGLLPPNAKISGDILFAGQNLAAVSEKEWQGLRGARIAMVFQDPMTSLNPHLRIATQMAEVLQRHQGLSQSAALAECERMLDAVQVPEARRRLRQYPHELSGGQRQRVMIASALLCRPQLLIADEPTTALDVTVQAQILRLLGELRREFKIALLLISHDLGVIAQVCERSLVLYAGRMLEQGPTSLLLERPRHPYTQALLAARPQQGFNGELLAIPGQVPAAGALFTGCAFAPRCAYRQAECAQQPPLTAGREQLWACHHPLR